MADIKDDINIRIVLFIHIPWYAYGQKMAYKFGVKIL